MADYRLYHPVDPGIRHHRPSRKNPDSGGGPERPDSADRSGDHADRRPSEIDRRGIQTSKMVDDLRPVGRRGHGLFGRRYPVHGIAQVVQLIPFGSGRRVHGYHHHESR